MTIQEVKDYLRIPLSTVYELSRQKKIRAVKIGKHWRYLESDILAYLGVAQTKFAAESEKRIHARINTQSPAVIKLLLPSKVELIVPARVQNLSAGGVLLKAKSEGLKVGDPVEIQFEHPSDGNVEIVCSGRIVHERKTVADESSEIGVKFRNLNRKDEETIRTYVG